MTQRISLTIILQNGDTTSNVELQNPILRDQLIRAPLQPTNTFRPTQATEALTENSSVVGQMHHTYGRNDNIQTLPNSHVSEPTKHVRHNYPSMENPRMPREPRQSPHYAYDVKTDKSSDRELRYSGGRFVAADESSYEADYTEPIDRKQHRRPRPHGSNDGNRKSRSRSQRQQPQNRPHSLSPIARPHSKHPFSDSDSPNNPRSRGQRSTERNHRHHSAGRNSTNPRNSHIPRAHQDRNANRSSSRPRDGRIPRVNVAKAASNFSRLSTNTYDRSGISKKHSHGYDTHSSDL